MACNTPIVATDVGDVSVILKKYKESLCNPDDINDLSKKIIAIINNINISINIPQRHYLSELFFKLYNKM